MTEARALAFKALSAASVPAVAWLVMPHNKGYWFNINNADLAMDYYVQFRRWETQNSLQVRTKHCYGYFALLHASSDIWRDLRLDGFPCPRFASSLDS